MENRIFVSKEILDFLTGIHSSRDNAKQRQEEIFDRAFKNAYTDMSTHTVVYKGKKDENSLSPYKKYINDNNKRCTENKKSIRNAIKNYLLDEKNSVFSIDLSRLKRISCKDEFDDWHENACETFVKIDCEVSELKLKSGKNEPYYKENLADFFEKNGTNDHIFSIGQAQKLINMMVKYLYIYYQCECLNTLEHLKDYAHVPIDRFVLNAAFGQGDYNGTPWSQIKTYEHYLSCKKEIDEHARNKGYVNGFQWELSEWPFSQEFSRFGAGTRRWIC